MGELFRILVLSFLFFNLCINGEKTLVPDADNNIGLSTNWIVPQKSRCTNSAWNHHGSSVNNKFPFFGVCSSSDCLLETTTYVVKNVEVIYAEIRFVGAYCKATSTPTTTGTPKLCTEYMTVNANFFNTIQPPGTSTEVGIRVPISDTFKIQVKSDPEFFETRQTIEFNNKENKNNIKYLFDAEDVCGSLKNFTVYYFKCPVVTQSLVKFKEYNAPSRLFGEKTHKGVCISNSVNIDGTELSMTCKWNGTVTTSGECVCIAGYEKKGTTCSRE